MTKAKTKKKKRTKQVDLETSIAVKPKCNHCDDGLLKSDRIIRELEHSGKYKGVPYSKITWKRGQCGKCGKWSVIKEYQ